MASNRRLYFHVLILLFLYVYACHGFSLSAGNSLQTTTSENLPSEKAQTENSHSKLSRRYFLAGAFASCTLPFFAPTSCEAKYGEAPKIEFSAETETSSGPVLYDEGEAAMISNKKKNVSKNWKSMTSKVKAALKKDNRKEAKSVLANGMANLKNDMRRISRAVSGGDIIVRVREGSEIPVFDYNSGQFQLKPAAAKAEAIFTKINDIYFSNNEVEVSDLLSSLSEAEVMFDEWCSLL